MSKIDITITTSTKNADFMKRERIEVKPHSTTIIAHNLPDTFMGRVARFLGLPPLVQVEISPARRGRPRK